MRAFLAVLFSAACASTTAAGPAERVAGCWIARGDDGQTTTMRWFADPSRPEVQRGDKLVSLRGGGTEAERYRLEPRQESWVLCLAAAGGDLCWQVAQGEEGALEGGRAFLDGHGGRLRISIVGDGADRVVFDGARRGCD